MPSLKKDDSKMYLTSGLRFGQADAIERYRRPYKNVEEMDEAMIKNWNEIINDEDLAFVIGDFSMADEDRTKEIISRLKGVKSIIMGDTDRWGTKWWVQNGFQGASMNPLRFDQLKVVLSYKPMLSCEDLNFFGRSSGSGRLPNHLCVAADAWELKPVRLVQLIREVGTFMNPSERTRKVKWN